MSALDDAIARLSAGYYNSDAYHAVDNPGGMDDGGHVLNFPAFLVDFGLIADQARQDAAALDAFGWPVRADSSQEFAVGNVFARAYWGYGPNFTAATTPANNDATYLLPKLALLSQGNDAVDVSKDADGSLKCEVETANKRFGFLHILSAAESAQLIGETVSLAIRAKGSGNITTLKMGVFSWTGTADTPTLDLVNNWAANPPSPVANWVQEGDILTLALNGAYQTETLDGVSIASAGAKQIALFFWVDDVNAQVDDTLNVQWFSGQVAEIHAGAPGYRSELADRMEAQKYGYSILEGAANESTGFGGQAIGSAAAYVDFTHPVEMFKKPAVTVATNGWKLTLAGGTSSTFTTLTPTAPGYKAWRGNISGGSGMTPGHATRLFSDGGAGRILVNGGIGT